MSPPAALERDMTDAQRLVEEIGRELGPTEQEIRHHPYLTALEAGRVRREELPRFAGEQYHIIRSDLRSVALLLNRFGTTPSGPFFQAVLGGETAALAALGAFAAAVGMDDAGLEAYEPAPGSHAYTAFMAWLALYGSAAEVAAGFLVNFAAWGANCGRMSRALRDRYGLTEKARLSSISSPLPLPGSRTRRPRWSPMVSPAVPIPASSSVRPGSSRAMRSSTGTRCTPSRAGRAGEAPPTAATSTLTTATAKTRAQSRPRQRRLGRSRNAFLA